MVRFVFLILITSSLCGCASSAQTDSILRSGGSTVRVRLLDVLSEAPISNAEVEVQSDNGKRCIQAPCDTNSKTWHGRSDTQGYVTIPTAVLQASSTIVTPAHPSGRDLIHDSRRNPNGEWVVELVPDQLSDPESGLRAIQLIDAQSNDPISDSPALVTFGRSGRIELEANSLGYIFIPIDKVARDLENTWVSVSGYQKAQVDFAWVRYKTRLVRQ